MINYDSKIKVERKIQKADHVQEVQGKVRNTVLFKMLQCCNMGNIANRGALILKELLVGTLVLKVLKN